MNTTNPPRSLEHLLALLLPSRDRETVSGDLCEEYRDRLPRLGRLRANLWYTRQVLSFTPNRLFWSAQRPALTLVCVFTAMSGTWLGIMDLVLKHPLRHEFISGAIVSQGLLTLCALYARSFRLPRPLLVPGGLAVLYLAATAFVGAFRGADVEGYILLISLALIVQVLLTLSTFTRERLRPTI